MRIMSDGVHQVRLAQAHAAIDEQRVVRLGGHLRYRQGHRVRKPVAGAHHEGIKGILGVEQRQRIAEERASSALSRSLSSSWP